MSQEVKLSSKLAKDPEMNGLDGLADSLRENPNQVICAIVWLTNPRTITRQRDARVDADRPGQADRADRHRRQGPRRMSASSPPGCMSSGWVSSRCRSTSSRRSRVAMFTRARSPATTTPCRCALSPTTKTRRSDAAMPFCRRCSHAQEAHEHYRGGADCSLCGCVQFRPTLIARIRQRSAARDERPGAAPKLIGRTHADQGDRSRQPRRRARYAARRRRQTNARARRRANPVRRRDGRNDSPRRTSSAGKSTTEKSG